MGKQLKEVKISEMVKFCEKRTVCDFTCPFSDICKSKSNGKKDLSLYEKYKNMEIEV